MTSPKTKQQLSTSAQAFRKLHQRDRLFVMPCAWDAFSAILFENQGFECVGTTSGGVNWVKGRMDYVYTTPKQEMLSPPTKTGEVAVPVRTAGSEMLTEAESVQPLASVTMTS